MVEATDPATARRGPNGRFAEKGTSVPTGRPVRQTPGVQDRPAPPPVPPPGPDGLVDAGWWSSRQEDHLRSATQVLDTGSPLNVIDHLELARRDPAHRFDAGSLDRGVVEHWCRRVDHWLDCADFDVLRLLTLSLGHGDRLPAEVHDALDERYLAFRYWYTDPGDPGAVDERWYWSENHRLIFHTCEHLAGQALAARTFTRTGLTGAEHRDRATARLHAWFDEKAGLGFSEWHSDVYYEKDLAPLLTLAELSDDPALAERAATFLDLLLLDLALHHHRGNVGCTHGRSYMKDKSRAADQPVFAPLKMCFDATVEPWPVDDGDHADLLPRNEGATLLGRARRYRPPDVVRRVATTTDEVLDREGMGVPIDPAEPLGPERDGVLTAAPRADGLSYTDPDMVPFWWDRGALTPWQLVPLMLDALDRHQLWDAWLFEQFRTVRDVVGDDRPTVQRLTHDLDRVFNAGLLGRVDTITWRNGHAMLSTAQSYRPGCAGFQHHVWQATLDERAVVFTNHPGNAPSADAGDWLDNDRYWTGSATLPRSVQHGRVAIHQYAPGFTLPDLDALSGFAYLDHTHAYVPTECFDEVVGGPADVGGAGAGAGAGDGRWTVLRRGGGYVALWSWRPVTWRDHDPAAVFTNGLTGRFDLVAEGGPEDVWIVEVGDVDRWGSFEAFVGAVTATTIDVVDHGWGDDGAHRGFDVRYPSPSEGVLEVGWTGPLRVDGREVPIGDHPRFDNPFTQVATGSTEVVIDDGAGAYRLDLAAGRRGPSADGS